MIPIPPVLRTPLALPVPPVLQALQAHGDPWDPPGHKGLPDRRGRKDPQEPWAPLEPPAPPFMGKRWNLRKCQVSRPSGHTIKIVSIDIIAY